MLTTMARPCGLYYTAYTARHIRSSGLIRHKKANVWGRAGGASISFSLSLLVLLLGFFSNAFAMTALQDEEMSVITGQALLQMGTQIGTGLSSDITFYKAGLDAEVAINMNIEK